MNNLWHLNRLHRRIGQVSTNITDLKRKGCLILGQESTLHRNRPNKVQGIPIEMKIALDLNFHHLNKGRTVYNEKYILLFKVLVQQAGLVSFDVLKLQFLRKKKKQFVQTKSQESNVSSQINIGFLGSPYEKDCYWRAPLESQTTNPNNQLTIRWHITFNNKTRHGAGCAHRLGITKLPPTKT